MTRLKRLAAGTAMAAALAGGDSAWAQQGGVMIEELIVTAQKREESIQDVAGAVAAMGAADIAERGVRTVQDLQFQMPNFQAGTSASSTIIFIRGVGQSVGQPGVATHVDGVYLSRPHLVALPQYDLERIEVLRGPQGTLYGRNATAGAVNFITRAPGSQFEGYGQVAYGNYDELRLQGAVDLPLGERVRSRVSLDYRDLGEGFVENVVPGNPDIGAAKTLSGRLRTQFDIAEDGVLDLVIWGAHTEGSGDYIVLNNQPTPLAVANNPYLAGAIVPLEPNRTSANRPSERDSTAYGATATLSWNLGEATLRSVTGYYWFDYTNSFDADGTNLDATPLSNWYKSRTFTQEFNLSGKTGDLDWLAGLYLMDDKLSNQARYSFPLGLNVPSLRSQLLPGASLITQGVPYRTVAYAGFADGTYNVSDRLRVIAGARYSREEQDNFQTNQNGPLSTPLGEFPVFTSCLNRYVPLEFEAFTPRGGVQYDLDDEDRKSAYFTISKGFKSGGLNQSSCGNSYQPEKLLAYEGGLKTRLLDGRLILNATAFYYDYQDFQITQITGLSAMIVNAPEATVVGLEIESAWSPDEHWTLNANASLLKSTYGEFSNTDSLAPALGMQDLDGNYLNYSPKASGNIGVQYRSSPQSFGVLTARAELYMTSRFYLREFNQDADSQQGYGRLNLSLMWDSLDKRLSARAYITNVTDEGYLSTMGVSDNLGARFVSWGMPRQFGLELTGRF
ncbi:TonB-dependent receptor domain-containing protein [Phenylobacterium sp.]|uniref:TonB-dependent receptor n=1 Tax=Phenylobacterium sp. TaxID=1871053 RepID=UPI0028975A35|nr:TonB-dependent receptor [Phenylobacterium sp.]